MALRSMQDSMTRNLRQFFETQLMGLARFTEARFVEETLERVAMAFTIDGRPYRIAIEPPDASPPLGRITLMGAGEPITGTIDSTTWAAIGSAIRRKHELHPPAVPTGNKEQCLTTI